ncbi:MAG: hypothetical protein ABSB82_08010 [Terriglobia bacterium]|jgi:hypothetical protein
MDNRSEVDNQKRLQKESAAELAVGALEGNPNPLDVDMGDVDFSPAILDLAGSPEEAETCPTPRCTRSDVDECILCGQLLRED